MEVAGDLGVSAQTTSRRHARRRDGGVAGMRTARQGKSAQLGPAGLGKIRRRTAGRTLVLRHRYRRCRQLSMCGLVAYRPGPGDRPEPATWMGFELLEGADDTRRCLRALDGLGHQPVTVIWDNLGAHHADDLQAWAATHVCRHRRVSRTTGYSRSVLRWYLA